MSIIIKNLTKKYKNGVTALNQLNLEIPGGIFGLLGENGAGKTTLMQILTTIQRPSEGSVSMDGVLYSETSYEKIQKKIGYLPQEIDLYPNLTVEECLEYMGALAGIPKAVCKKRIDEYLEKTGLCGHRKKKMRQLSGGMKRRAALVQAMLSEPDFLIADEPAAGLDPQERIRIRNLLADFSKNRTVLFSTHVVEDLAAVCSRLAVMKKGRILYSGSTRQLLEAAEGHVWSCIAADERTAGEMEERYLVSFRQYMGDGGIKMKIVSGEKPVGDCVACEVTLEDAYVFAVNFFEKCG